MTVPSPRAAWLHACISIAPRVPLVLLNCVSAVLANPASNSDVLLIHADGLMDAAAEAALSGRPCQAEDLTALADLFRHEAPRRTSRATIFGVDYADGPDTTAVATFLPDGTLTWWQWLVRQVSPQQWPSPKPDDGVPKFQVRWAGKPRTIEQIARRTAREFGKRA